MVERWLLADKCEMGAVLVDVERQEFLAIDIDTADYWIVESLQEGNRSGIATSTSSDERNVLPGLDMQFKSSQNRLVWSRWVPEMHVSELDMAFYTLDHLTIMAPVIGIWRSVEQSLKTSSSVPSFRNIRCIAEDGPCRLRREDNCVKHRKILVSEQES